MEYLISGCVLLLVIIVAAFWAASKEKSKRKGYYDADDITWACIIAGAGVFFEIINTGCNHDFLGFSLNGAKYKADIINREYHTNYSQLEVFYASDVIDTVRQLDRQRIEVNGNLLQNKAQEVVK